MRNRRVLMSFTLLTMVLFGFCSLRYGRAAQADAITAPITPSADGSTTLFAPLEYPTDLTTDIAWSEGASAVVEEEPTTTPESSHRIELIGSIAMSDTEGVYVNGDYAYVASGGLRIVDVSNPATPVEVGYSEYDSTAAVFASGNYAYTVSDDKFRVIDVSDPTAPTELASYDTPGMSYADIYVRGNYAYVTRYLGDYGLWVIDVSNPIAPVAVSTYESTIGTNGLTVDGNYVYIAEHTKGLMIVDVSTPNAPVSVTNYAMPSDPIYIYTQAEDVHIQGNYAYIVYSAHSEGLESFEERLLVLDISNPASPVEMGQYTAPLSDIAGRAVYVSGDHAYLAGGNRLLVPDGGWLRVVDISNPAAPVEVGGYEHLGAAEDVYVSEDLVYIADELQGLVILRHSVPAPPPTFPNKDIVGQLGGGSHAVTIQSNYAYIGIGPRLAILDVSDAASPILLGQTAALPGVVKDVYISGDYAYVASGWYGGLRVIDVSNPATPVEVGSYHETDGAENVYVNGNYAYVSDWGYGLRVLDVSNPATPVKVGSHAGFATDVYINGNYAYVAAGDSGLRVLDVSNPAAPTEMGSCNTPGEARAVYIIGNYAYVANDDEGLRVIDVSNPGAPTEVSGYPANDIAEVYVRGSYAYIVDIGSGVEIVDISNPMTPTEVGHYSEITWSEDLYVNENYAYIGTWGGGLQIVNVSNPATPTLTGKYDTVGDVESVDGTGNYAYLAADWGGGLRVVDVSNPPAPSVVGHCDTGWAQDVQVSGNYVYVADDVGRSLRVIDVSVPTAPTEVGSCNVSGDAEGLHVKGNYAYVAAGGAGLRVIDVSGPAMPREVGSCNTLEYPNDVYVSGNHAYVIDNWSQLRVIDVSVPTMPTEIGGYVPPSGDADSVYVHGNYAYLETYEALLILDVSNPTAPTLIGRYDSDNGAVAHIIDNYAYVMGDGLLVLDVSDPTTPLKIGSYETPAWGSDFYIQGDYAYIANNSGGLVILRVVLPSTTGTVAPESGGALDYTVMGGLTTTINIPPGAVAINTTITYTAISAVSPPTGMRFAQHAFALEANNPVSGPITVTIHYADADITAMDELSLTLYTRNGEVWAPAETCGATTVDADNNVFRTVLCHFSDYALVGPRAEYEIYLPVILKNHNS